MQEIKVYPPLNGIIIDIRNVPDPVFSGKMVGDGVAIEPLSNQIYAPITGRIKSIHKAKHAITFTSSDGLDILVHIGLETVTLGGNGFNLLVKEGDKVKEGEQIGEFDIKYVVEHAKSLISPIILADLDSKQYGFTVSNDTDTNMRKPIIRIVKKTDKKEASATKSQVAITYKSDAITVKNLYGIHARPAALISQLANESSDEVFIEKDGKKFNAKSVLALLSSSIAQNDTIYIHASSKVVIDKLIEIINNFEDKEHNIVTPAITTVDGHIMNGKYYGIAASTGAVVGKLVKRSQAGFTIKELAEDPLLEKESILSAISKVKKDLEYDLTHFVAEDLSYKDILGAHLEILKDPQILSGCLEQIDLGKTAAHAIWVVIEDNCAMLRASKNQLLIERQTDLKDLRNRILAVIDGVEAKAIKLIEPSILLADELTPTDLVNIDANIVGLVSVTGGASSHVAILARVRGLPLLVGVNASILDEANDITAILDASSGYIDLTPESVHIEELQQKMVLARQQHEIHLANAKKDAITVDGHKIKCLANITGVEESSRLRQNGADGVGLFRTEFIYFNRDDAPSVDEQHQVYSAISCNLLGQTFTIRTLDAGGDKPVNYLKFPHEQNPALGIRGIRLCLEHESLLIDQLTAILKVLDSNIKIMLPMISDLSEYRRVKEIIESLKQKLNITHKIELGIMVEVPSVALLSEVFASDADFFSIGTNDLTQYTMAIDREHSKLAAGADHLHPAVLKSIELTVKGALRYNRPVSVCGLMASEKLGIAVLVGLGITELSMNMNVIAENKEFIRMLDFTKCKSMADHCLTLGTAAEVRAYLRNNLLALI